MSETYALAWREYRKRQILAVGSMVAFFVVPSCVVWLTNESDWRDWTVGIILVVLLISVFSSSRFGHAQDAAKSLVALRTAVAIAVSPYGRKANLVEVPATMMRPREDRETAIEAKESTI